MFTSIKLTSCDITIFMITDLYSYKISKVGYIQDLVPSFVSLFVTNKQCDNYRFHATVINFLHIPQNSFREAFKQFSKTECCSTRLFLEIMYLVAITPFQTRKFALPNFWYIYSTTLKISNMQSH